MKMEDIKRKLLGMPVVELVRCKNCIFQGGLNSEGRHTCRHFLGLIIADDDSFCSYGDKKED